MIGWGLFVCKFDLEFLTVTNRMSLFGDPELYRLPEVGSSVVKTENLVENSTRYQNRYKGSRDKEN